MCLDIDPDSVIHKHLRKKIFNLDKETATQICDEPIKRTLDNKILLWNCKGNLEGYYDTITSKHSLTMLPSFHISLGAPNNVDPKDLWFKDTDIMTIVGDIALANIHISKKDNKKSAWIPLHPNSFHFLPSEVFAHFPSVSTENQNCHSVYDNWLHISLANLTGNPHDSIARPEDCIIDTITA